jgi:hypothetical protein
LFQYDFNQGGKNAIYSAIANATAEDYSSLLNLIPKVDDNIKYLVLNKLGKIAPQAMPTINLDSLREFDDEALEDCLENLKGSFKFQFDFDREELARDMEELRKDLANMKMEIHFDAKQMAEDVKREMENLKIEIHNLDEDMLDTNEMKMYFKDFDSEDFKKNMEKMKIELKGNLLNMTEELKKNAEQWKKDAEQWEKDKEQWKKDSEQWEKDFKFNFNFDSLDIKIEGLEDLQKLYELEGLENMKIDTTDGKRKFYFKFDDKKHKDHDKDKDDEDKKDKEDGGNSAEEI